MLEHLRDRRALVIMDNCEHLTVGVARHVDELLRACPGVQVVATSREPLGLRGERIWRLAPLASDDAAVQLFCDRAGLTSTPDDSLRATVVELCRLLDRLPLAIELAAARCDVLAPAEILARLGRQPTLLRSDDPTISARQRSLDDTIAWSHELLSTDEQLAFRRLGVFAAGFGLEAATAAVADDDIDPYDVPELVWSLVSKSLVASEPAAGSTRYRMLDTVRAFAQRQLARSGELAPVAVRLGRFYVDSFGPQLEKADAQLLAERAREIDNMRALIPIVAPHDEELAQHLACTVVVSHRRASPRTGGDEGLRLLDQLTARTPTRVALLVDVVILAVDQGLIDVAADLLDEAELLAADVGSPPWIDGRIDQFRGIIAIHRGDSEGHVRIAHAALARTTSRGRPVPPAQRAVPGGVRGERVRRSPRGGTGLARDLDAARQHRGARRRPRQPRRDRAARREPPRRGSTPVGVPRPRARARLAPRGHLGLGRRRPARRPERMTGRPRPACRAPPMPTMARIGLSLYPMDRAVCDELLAAAPSHTGSVAVRRPARDRPDPHRHRRHRRGAAVSLRDRHRHRRLSAAPHTVPDALVGACGPDDQGRGGGRDDDADAARDATGVGGGDRRCGKTTLARRLADALDVPHVELDAIFHQPRWTELPVDEFRHRVGERDGGRRMGHRWQLRGGSRSGRAAADTVVWLDRPRGTVMRRLIVRSVAARSPGRSCGTATASR